ncbi:MAG: nickel pincer cofactor biosynthesis protein LarB [Bacillota bacterium]|nr:nickel pincer cofactor biosynthesis protein LarB [Bacillota bacterium]
MDHAYLVKLLEDYKDGKNDLDEVLQKLKILPYEDLGFAKIDHHRALRRGFPEVIFCQGKTVEQVVKIFQSLADYNHNIMATRAGRDVFEDVRNLFPQARYHEMAKIISLTAEEGKKYQRKILVISAGTADIPVAEEAAVTAEIMGHSVEKIYDAGVAGIHRLLVHLEQLQSAGVIIVAAGMEGALPSVVAGLVDIPVIAVPTSIGYGANFNGLSALLTMLNSCANGIGVVNIDNGFGAAALADTIIRSGIYSDPISE